MNIVNVVEINRSPADVWQVVAKEFDQAHKWMGFVENSYAIEGSEKLEKIFNSKQIDSLKESFICISSKDSIILGKNLPLNIEYHGDYKISSGKRKIYILRNNHEKYRFLPRPDDKWPNLHFRIRNGKKGILVNLSLDPDGWDYYEYILKE